MHADDDIDFDEEWVIWNGGHGLVTTATLGQIEAGPEGLLAWLEEPFDMVGPFCLETLLTEGRIAFAACMVMSRLRWQTDQAFLRRESLHLRRQTEQRMRELLERLNGRYRQTPATRPALDEKPHREALQLPATGALESSQVKRAFRRLAQKAHPDLGGSQEQFVRLTRARDALLGALA